MFNKNLTLEIGKAMLRSASILKSRFPSLRGKSLRLGETPEEAKSLCLEWIRGLDRCVEKASKEGSHWDFERAFIYGRRAVKIIPEMVDDPDIGDAVYVALLDMAIYAQKRNGGSLLDLLE